MRVKNEFTLLIHDNTIHLYKTLHVTGATSLQDYILIIILAYTGQTTECTNSMLWGKSL